MTEHPLVQKSKNPNFPSTHWSIVSLASEDGPDRPQALEELCCNYWYPVYSFVRRSGKNPTDAEDITQAFFATLLTCDSISNADRSRGRFRTYMLTMLERRMTDAHRRETATKRGGGVKFVSFDVELAERKYKNEPNDKLLPDVVFERRWASALLDLVMEKLREEYVENGKGELFSILEPFIPWNSAELPQQHAADQLAIGVAAVRMEIFYLRRRYRELLRAEVAKTVADPSEIDSELQELRMIFT